MKLNKTALSVCAALALILSGCAERSKEDRIGDMTKTREVPPETTSVTDKPAETEEEPVRETDAEDFETVEENGRLTISRYTGEDTSVVIPAEIDGKAVVRIGAGAFRENTEIESVTIPDGVLSIGEEAFFGCTRLKEAVLPDSVASIESFAFMWCDNLENVVFPNRAVEMGRNIFSGNIIDAEHPDPCPWICKMREENPLVIVNGNLLDAMECDGEIVVPDGVLSICPSAFSEVGLNMRPTGVRLSEGITRIPAALFQGCRRMESVTIPDSVTEIGSGAFEYCYGLDQLTLPDGVVKIDGSLFSPLDHCTVVYRGESYPPERYDDLYAAINGE